jgi:hypothetical protein
VQIGNPLLASIADEIGDWLLTARDKAMLIPPSHPHFLRGGDIFSTDILCRTPGSSKGNQVIRPYMAKSLRQYTEDIDGYSSLNRHPITAKIFKNSRFVIN